MRIEDNLFNNIKIGNALPKIEPLADSDDSKDSKFQELFSTIMSGSNETSRELSATSRELTAQLLTGQLDDLAAMQVAGEKSSLAFELNMNIRTKVLEAYSEIMKTQV